jgi:TolA-binding protein
MINDQKSAPGENSLKFFSSVHPCLSVFICGYLFLFPALVLASEGMPGPTATPEDSRSLFDKAQKLFDEKNYKQSKDILNQLVAKHPMEDFIPKAKLLLANLQEDFNVSTAQFKSLAAEYNNRPEGEEAQKDLGARYYLADKYNDAADSYKEFLDSYPKSASLPEVRYWYASSLLALDKNDEAADQFRKVLGDAKDSAWAPKSLMGIGSAYFKMKKYSDAQSQYLRILDQYPRFDELNLVYLKLGQTYESEQKWKEAHAAYQTLIQKYPKSLEVVEGRERLRALETRHPDLPHALEAEAPEPTPTAVEASVQPTPTAEAVESDSTPEPETATRGEVSKPFHVQVGVYSKKSNVDKTRKLIRKAGYISYVVKVQQEGVPFTYFKVRVGHFADKAAAEKAARELARKTGEKAIVIED